MSLLSNPSSNPSQGELLFRAKYTPQAQWVYILANGLADKDGYLGTSHILRALLDACDGEAARVLQRFPIDENQLALIHEFGLEHERPRKEDYLYTPVTSELPPTSLAWDSSKAFLGRSKKLSFPISTGGLLLAILSIPNSFANRAVRELGHSPRRIRAEVKRQMARDLSPRSERENPATIDASVSLEVTLQHDADLVWAALTDLQLFGQNTETELVDATRTSREGCDFFETLSLRRNGVSEVHTYETSINDDERTLRRRGVTPADHHEPVLSTRLRSSDGVSTMSLAADYRVVDASRQYQGQASRTMLKWAQESADEVVRALDAGWRPPVSR